MCPRTKPAFGACLVPAILAMIVCCQGAGALAGDQEFWFCFPESDPDHLMRVGITATAAASGTLSIPGLAFVRPFAVPAGGSTTITLPLTARLIGSGVTAGVGVHVLADSPVTVTAEVRSPDSGDAFVARPVESLGDAYYIVSWEGLPEYGYPGEFAVVSLADGTMINITPSVTTDDGHLQGQSYQFPLDAGQAYQVQASTGDLSGTYLFSDRPVAVISGHQATVIPDLAWCCADFLVEMLPPVSQWGTEFFVGPTATRNTGDWFRVTASRANTVLSIPGQMPGPLGPGQSFIFPGSSFVSVAATAPVLLTQYFPGGTLDGADADPSMLLVPPRAQWTTEHRFQVPAGSTAGDYANFIVDGPGSPTVTFDGEVLPGSIFGDYFGGRYFGSIPLEPGPHFVVTSRPSCVSVYGFRPGASYGFYTAGRPGLPPEPPVTTPVITSIADVPNDQGRQVRLEWARSPQDSVGSATPVIQYVVFRKHDPGLGTLKADWDFLVTVPAFAEPDYAAVVPTLADSTIANGPYRSVFFVRAGTGNPAQFFDSPPDSGYSLDNLVPHVPTGLALSHEGPGNRLIWETCPDHDFQYFRIYRGVAVDLQLGPWTLAHETTGTTWLDAAGGDHHFYVLAAVDFAGNESPLAPIGPLAASGVPAAAGTGLRLHPNQPNPFNPRTTIKYDLPESGSVRLSVFDVAGRLVRTLVDESMAQGRHEAVWDGRDSTGKEVGSGSYLARLEFGGRVETVRMGLIR